MGPRTGSFEPSDRLRRPAEFRRVSQFGTRSAGEAFIVLRAVRQPEGSGHRTRLGLTVSRKVGGAVERNRVKRRVREWFRHARPRLRAGTDWLVIARARARSVTFAQLTAELDRLSGAPRGVDA